MANDRRKKVYGKYAHYWRQEMKPLLVAAACVDITVKHSQEASLIYQQVIDAWDKPECQALLKDKIVLPFVEIRAWEKVVTGNNEYNSEQGDFSTG